MLKDIHTKDRRYNLYSFDGKAEVLGADGFDDRVLDAEQTAAAFAALSALQAAPPAKADAGFPERADLKDLKIKHPHKLTCLDATVSDAFVFVRVN